MVIIYLAAIVAANLFVARFGPAVSIVNAFVFVGIDLVARDRLHEAWHNDRLALKMACLIAAGSLLSYLLNRNAGQIALASFVAFALAATADTIVYSFAVRRGWQWLARSNASNLAGAAVDSAIFPLLAFGAFMPLIMLGQFVAKTAGGLLWSFVLAEWLAQEH